MGKGVTALHEVWEKEVSQGVSTHLDDELEFKFTEGADMSEQLPDYTTDGAKEYLVHWHNGTDPTYSYVLADYVFIDPDTNILTLSLAGEIQFFSQTWTSVFKSTNKPK